MRRWCDEPLSISISIMRQQFDGIGNQFGKESGVVDKWAEIPQLLTGDT